MAHGLGYPDAVETAAVREEVAHGLGVQLQETRGAVAEFYRCSSCCDGFAGRAGCGCCFREISGHLDLFAADGDAGDMAAVVEGEMARCTPDPASDVEDCPTLFQLRALQQQRDELDLSALFGVAGGEEVAVVDVLAPLYPGLSSWIIIDTYRS